jgi:3-hydroxybutyryl-CoA dehydrogenase
VSDGAFQRVAVVGAGTMGNGIAQTFASFGAEVVLIDVVEPALK